MRPGSFKSGQQLNRALLIRSIESGVVNAAAGSSWIIVANYRDQILKGAAKAVLPRGLDLCGQATKGTWGMSWRQEASKGVEDCEKLGGAVKRVLIPRFPNWHTLNP